MIPKFFITLIALEHLYILYFEMLKWETIGKRIFYAFPKSLFKSTKILAANQGLYNGFLSAGLIWSLVIKDKIWAENIAVFFLICVLIAGFYGGLTISKKIYFVQALPAFIALVLIHYSK
jgi:putative membrane protein